MKRKKREGQKTKVKGYRDLIPQSKRKHRFTWFLCKNMTKIILDTLNGFNDLDNRFNDLVITY